MSNYNQAILSNPKDAVAYHKRAKMKYKLNDRQGALADYNQAILLNPKFSLAYLGRWDLKLYRLKDYQGALEDYTKFREIMMLKAMDP